MLLLNAFEQSAMKHNLKRLFHMKSTPHMEEIILILHTRSVNFELQEQAMTSTLCAIVSSTVGEE